LAAVFLSDQGLPRHLSTALLHVPLENLESWKS
jgi:hypothetical protein